MGLGRNLLGFLSISGMRLPCGWPRVAPPVPCPVHRRPSGPCIAVGARPRAPPRPGRSCHAAARASAVRRPSACSVPCALTPCSARPHCPARLLHAAVHPSRAVVPLHAPCLAGSKPEKEKKASRLQLVGEEAHIQHFDSNVSTTRVSYLTNLFVQIQHFQKC